MSPKSQYPTVAEVMIRRGGLRNMFKAMTYVASWSIARDAIGHDPTWREYGEFWKQSEGKTRKEVVAFRACVPEGVTVAQLLDSARPAGSDREAVLGELMASRWSF